MSTGRFCWFDLQSTDVPAARAFYGALFGWDVRAHNPQYTMIHDGEGKSLGGMMAAPPARPSAWLAYVTTSDLAATMAAVRAQGGRVFLEHAAPGVGPFAVFADRQGAVLAAIQLEHEEGAYPSEKAVNQLTWSELHTPDPTDALAFHAAVFGWTSETWGDGFLVGEAHEASIVRGAPGAPAAWLVYANVADTDATATRAVALGGTVRTAPRDLAHVGRYAVLVDPTGAPFAVMQSFARG